MFTKDELVEFLGVKFISVTCFRTATSIQIRLKDFSYLMFLAFSKEALIINELLSNFFIFRCNGP